MVRRKQAVRAAELVAEPLKLLTKHEQLVVVLVPLRRPAAHPIELCPQLFYRIASSIVVGRIVSHVARAPFLKRYGQCSAVAYDVKQW